MYSQPVRNENYLRGVQAAADDGTVSYDQQLVTVTGDLTSGYLAELTVPV